MSVTVSRWTVGLYRCSRPCVTSFLRRIASTSSPAAENASSVSFAWVDLHTCRDPIPHEAAWGRVIPARVLCPFTPNPEMFIDEVTQRDDPENLHGYHSYINIITNITSRTMYHTTAASYGQWLHRTTDSTSRIPSSTPISFHDEPSKSSTHDSNTSFLIVPSIMLVGGKISHSFIPRVPTLSQSYLLCSESTMFSITRLLHCLTHVSYHICSCVVLSNICMSMLCKSYSSLRCLWINES